jgi:hypothetical protein
MLPWLTLVLATAMPKLVVGSVSSIDIVRIYGVALGSMVTCGVVMVVLTVGFGGEGQIRSTPIIVLVVLVLIWKRRH